MIVGFIVIAALVLGGLYFLLWLLKKGFRQQVEHPKYIFQQQVDAFNASQEGRQVSGESGQSEQNREGEKKE